MLIASADALPLARVVASAVPPVQFLIEMIRLVVMMYVRVPLPFRTVEDLLAERGIDVCHEAMLF